MACSVPSCSNKSTSVKNPEKNIAFHRFPTDIKYRNKWIQAVGRTYWAPTKNSRICSEHFKDEDIIFAGNKGYLKLNAVPTLNVTKPLQVVTQPPQLVTHNQEENALILRDPLEIKVEEENDFENMITKHEVLTPSLLNEIKPEINYQKELNKKDNIIKAMSLEISNLKISIKNSESKLRKTEAVKKARLKTIYRLRKRDQRNTERIKKLEEVIAIICEDQNINGGDLMSVMDNQEHVC